MCMADGWTPRASAILKTLAEAGIALAALRAAVVGSVDPAPQRECLLGGAALFAWFADRLAERGIGRGSVVARSRSLSGGRVLLSTGYKAFRRPNQISAPAQL